MKHSILAGTILAVSALASQGALVNLDFEDTTGTFPTGWTAASVTSTTGLVAGSTTAALIGSGGSLMQDGDMQAGESTLMPFQLDFVMSVSDLGAGNRIRLRSDGNSGDIITLNLDASGLRKYAVSWYTAVPAANFPGGSVSTDTPYYIRVMVDDFDSDSAMEYKLGVSTDGTNYSESIVMGSFHGIHPFETIRFESGSGTMTVDNVAFVPEPSATVLFGLLAGLGLLARRRS